MASLAHEGGTGIVASSREAQQKATADRTHGGTMRKVLPIGLAVIALAFIVYAGYDVVNWINRPPHPEPAVAATAAPTSVCGLPQVVFVESTTEWKRVSLRPGCRSHGARSPGAPLEFETDLGRRGVWVSGKDFAWLPHEGPHWYRVRLKEPGRPVQITETFTPVR